MKRRLILSLLFILAAGAMAQDTFTSSATKPFVFTGALASIPATCRVGTLAFITNATAGQNVYECASANTWTQESGGGSGSPGGVTGNWQANGPIGVGGSFDGVLDTSYDNLRDSSAANSAIFQLNRTWTDGGASFSMHGVEPIVQYTGSHSPNTLAAYYGTFIWKGTAGAGHIGASMHRGQDGGTGGTVTDADLNYADYNSTGTPTDAFTRLTFYKAAGGSITGGVGNNYGTICGFCYGIMTLGGNTAAALEVGTDISMPGLSDSRKTSFIGVAIGGGRDANKYDAMVVDSGKSYFKQGIKQGMTYDSSVVAPLTSGGTFGFDQSNFHNSGTDYGMHLLNTTGNAASGSMIGISNIVDVGGSSGTITLASANQSQCSGSGAATTTTCRLFEALNSAILGSLGTGVAFYAGTMKGSNVTTGYGIWTAGPSDFNRFDGQVGIHKIPTTTSTLAIAGLPTSSAGLVTGDVWANSNVLTIVP